MATGAAAIGAWATANASTIAAVGTLASSGMGYASYQSGKKEAKSQKNRIADERRAAETKRSSLIRQQRAQLGGKDGYSVNNTSSTGLTQQGEETLG